MLGRALLQSNLIKTYVHCRYVERRGYENGDEHSFQIAQDAKRHQDRLIEQYKFLPFFQRVIHDRKVEEAEIRRQMAVYSQMLAKLNKVERQFYDLHEAAILRYDNGTTYRFSPDDMTVVPTGITIREEFKMEVDVDPVDGSFTHDGRTYRLVEIVETQSNPRPLAWEA